VDLARYRCLYKRGNVRLWIEADMRRIATAILAVTLIGVAWVSAQTQSASTVVRLEPALDAIIAADAKAELLKGEYFGFVEGPVWVQEGRTGYLLFSDVAANAIYKWAPDGKLSVFLARSGYTGTDTANVGGQSFNGRLNLIVFGSVGITLDRQGRVVFTTHGNRTIERHGSPHAGRADARWTRGVGAEMEVPFSSNG
jgi:hypothetical protein